eukprot:12215111-Alexandrium_andersonii.AAC.1
MRSSGLAMLCSRATGRPQAYELHAGAPGSPRGAPGPLPARPATATDPGAAARLRPEGSR